MRTLLASLRITGALVVRSWPFFQNKYRRMSVEREPELQRTPQSVDEYYECIKANDIGGVNYWFKHRLAAIHCFEEAGIDLALRLNHRRLAGMIKHELLLTDREHKKTFRKPKSSLYKRTVNEYEDRYYFSKILMESYDNGRVSIWVVYRTPLEAPYLAEKLLPLGGRDLHNSIIFNLSLDNQNEDELRQSVNRIFETLQEVGCKDKSYIHREFFSIYTEALETFFLDAKHDFQPHQEKLKPIKMHKDNTYEAYSLYKAVITANSKNLLSLLKQGANPNLLFSGCTTLWYAVHLGVNYVFNKKSPGTEESRRRDLLQTVRYLLEYGADPTLKMDNKTLMEDMVCYAQYVSEEERTLYEDIIALLTTHQYQKPQIDVHETQRDTSMGRVVNTANEAIFKSMIKVPCISKTRKSNSSLLLQMIDNRSLKLVSQEGSSLNENEEEYGYYEAFFLDKKHTILQKDGDSNNQAALKRAYFKDLMTPHSGKIIVDTVHEGMICKGLIISEVIPAQIKGKESIIYYGKLALADIPHYEGLVKGLILFRAMAQQQKQPTLKHFYYCEAASANGFAVFDELRRYPIHPVLQEQIEEIMQRVYEHDPVTKIKDHDTVYIEDSLSIKETTKINNTMWLSRKGLVRFNFFESYFRAGCSLPVALEITRENFSIFRKTEQRLIGERPFKDLSQFYSR